MVTNFPINIDTKVSPLATDLTNGPVDATYGNGHAAEHKFANDAIVALETKVGKNSSAVTTSHDYKLSTVTGSDKAETQGNKSTDGTFAANSDTLYPSQKATKTYIASAVAGLLDDRGNYDASGNVFPSSGGSGPAGAILKGDLWFISVAGVLGGVTVSIGDTVRALVDAPGSTASNWDILSGQAVVRSINSDTTQAQTIVGAGGASVNTVGGVTTITAGASTGYPTVPAPLYPTENVSIDSALATTYAKFSDATTPLNFGMSTTYQKSAFECFGSGVAMNAIKLSLSGQQQSIAFGATSQAIGASPLTWSHTCTGSNRLLIVQVDNAAAVSGVTYNGVSMTDAGASDSERKVFYLIAPAAGANNIVVTASSGGTVGTAISYTGVHQSSPIDSIGSFDTPIQTSGTALNGASTTVVNQFCWAVGFCTFIYNNTPTGLTSAGTDRITYNANGGPMISDSNGVVGTGPQGFVWTQHSIGASYSGNSMTVMAIRPLDGTPDNATIRIETDAAGSPSGALANANAHGTVAGSTLTSILTDTAISLAGAFTLTGGVKYWIVLTRSGSLSDTNYYSAGYLPSTSRVFTVNKFDGASWNVTAANSQGYYQSGLGGFSYVTKADSSLANSNNFIGFADTAVSVGTVVNVDTYGVVSGLSVIPNQTYYLSTAGAIATSGSVKVGKGIQGNKLLIVQPPL